MYWDGVWSVRASVSVPLFSSCRYMCTTSVSTYLLSSVCFKHMCIVKRHTSLWGADKQPDTNTGFFSGYQGRSIVVISLNTTQGTLKCTLLKKTRDHCLFQCECLSLAISSLPLNLKWGTGRRSGYKKWCRDSGYRTCLIPLSWGAWTASLQHFQYAQLPFVCFCFSVCIMSAVLGFLRLLVPSWLAQNRTTCMFS